MHSPLRDLSRDHGLALVHSRLPAHSAMWLAAALAIGALGTMALLVQNRLDIDAATPAFGALAALTVVLAAVRFAMRSPVTRGQVRARDFSESALALVVMATLGALASYGAAADTSGFYDATLERTDQLLHFDWVSLYLLVVAHPVLQHLGAAAYGSVFISPWALIAWHAWHGERAQAHRFLLTFWTAAVLTIALFPLLPARGALEFLWHGPVRYMPTNGLYQGEIIPALRHHAITSIDLGAVRGLVCAPSFHTICAIIYCSAAWPIPPLRRTLVPLNVAMLIATPVEGTHYLTDMLIGAAVAVFAIWLVRQLMRLAERGHHAGRVRSLA